MFAEASLTATLNGQLAALGARQNGYESGPMQQAIALFREIRLRARAGQLAAFLTRRSRDLQSLSQSLAEGEANDRHYAGLRTVPVSRICGSEGRSVDFDRDFLPLQEHSRERWLSVARARLSGVPLPPVELVQVKDAYYVRDGHHRISVAKALGEGYIEAEVTVWGADVEVR